MADSKKPRCRKRLVPFLKNMIGKCPGVVWENEQESTFRIPWRHNSNKEWNSVNDCKILFEYAKLTGKYDGKHEYPKWKTQLRNAMRRVDGVKERTDLHNKTCEQPYKVYQFIEGTSKKDTNGLTFPVSPDNESSCDSFCQEEINEANVPYQQPEETFVSRLASGPDYLLGMASPQPCLPLAFYQNSHTTGTGGIPTVVQEDVPMSSAVIGMQLPTVVEEVERNMSELPTIQISENFVTEVYSRCNQPQAESTIQISKSFVTEVNGRCNQPQAESTDMCVSLPEELKNIPTYDLIPDNQDSTIQISKNFVTEDNSRCNQAQAESTDMCVSLPEELKNLPTSDLVPDNQSCPSSLSIPSVSSLSVQPPYVMTLWYGFQKRLQVMCEDITERQCCNIYADLSKLRGGTPVKCSDTENVRQLEIPAPEQCKGISKLDQMQIDHLKKLLDNMEKGVTLSVRNGDLYVKRLCKTRVFVSNRRQQNYLLLREADTKIFDSNNINESKVYLTFGQEVSLPPQKPPMRKVLICLRIEHTRTSQINGIYNHLSLSTASLEPLISDDTLLTEEAVDQFGRMKVASDGVDIRR